MADDAGPDDASEHDDFHLMVAPPQQPMLAGMEPARRPESPRPVVRHLWWALRSPAATRYVLPAVMVLLIGIIAINDHFGGVDWGDDFALYMHQAKALA
ncbi:MAG: hypothetical protein JO265_00085, partial [Acidimicrobiia bacterium]|nr:hypothetical protein [Acidimicrobiia bacterium]